MEGIKMINLLVVEGLDGTGKTTLAKRLSQETGMEYVKLVKDTKDVNFAEKLKNDTFEALETAESGERQLIYDRFPLISEAVYGPVLRGKNALGDLYYPLWERFLSLKPIIIYCRPLRETIWANLIGSLNNQMDGVWKNRDELLRVYDQFFAQLMENLQQTKILVYDYVARTFYTNAALYTDMTTRSTIISLPELVAFIKGESKYHG